MSDPARGTSRDVDYKVSSVLLYVSQAMDFMRLARIDYEVLTALALIAHEGYRAVTVRGARVEDLVEAWRRVNRGGSIAGDLPSTRGDGG